MRESTGKRKAGFTPRFGGVPGKYSLFWFLIKSLHYT